MLARFKAGAPLPLFSVGHVNAVHALPVPNTRAFGIRIVQKCLNSQQNLSYRCGWTPAAMPRSVFRVENVIQPVLPGQANLQNFPGVEELMGLAGNPEDGKLYLRADASRLEEPAHDYDRSLFSEFVENATDVKDLLEMSSMYKGHALEIKSADRYETPESEADLIWSLCLSLCYEVDLQQEIFSKDNYSDIMAICIDRINSIKARMEEE